MSIGFVKIKKAIGYLLSCVCVAALVNVFFANLNGLAAWKYSEYWLLVIPFSLFVLLLGHLNLVLTWWFQLRGLSLAFSIRESFSIVGVSQVAKYLPGNVAQFIGRIYLAKDKFSKVDLLASMIVEALMMASVAGFFALIWISIFFVPDFYSAKIGFLVLVFFSAAVFSLCLYLRRRYSESFFSLKNLVVLFLMYFFAFFLHGLVIFLMAKFIFCIPDVSFIVCVLGFSFAFLVGYVLPGAPGGLGVREIAFVALFSGFFGEAQALNVILLYRLVSVASDFVFFLAAYLVKEHDQKL